MPCPVASRPFRMSSHLDLSNFVDASTTIVWPGIVNVSAGHFPDTSEIWPLKSIVRPIGDGAGCGAGAGAGVGAGAGAGAGAGDGAGAGAGAGVGAGVGAG